jgi:hypothetical protein
VTTAALPGGWRERSPQAALVEELDDPGEPDDPEESAPELEVPVDAVEVDGVLELLDDELSLEVELSLELEPELPRASFL